MEQGTQSFFHTHEIWITIKTLKREISRVKTHKLGPKGNISFIIMLRK